MDESEPIYKRILLKISGESLQRETGFGLSESVLKDVAKEIQKVYDLGVQIGLVVGGGNFFRGRESENSVVKRATSDYMGMLATIMNGLALCDAIESLGVNTKLVSALPIEKLSEPLANRKIIKYLNEGDILVFTAGTGLPYFSTDTGAALRAIEIGADVFLKATMVDGVYNDDPQNNPDAERYSKISFKDVVDKDLKVLDMSAVILCRDHNLDIKVFNIHDKNAIYKAVVSEETGTVITNRVGD